MMKTATIKTPLLCVWILLGGQPVSAGFLERLSYAFSRMYKKVAKRPLIAGAVAGVGVSSHAQNPQKKSVNPEHTTTRAAIQLFAQNMDPNRDSWWPNVGPEGECNYWINEKQMAANGLSFDSRPIDAFREMVLESKADSEVQPGEPGKLSLSAYHLDDSTKEVGTLEQRDIIEKMSVALIGKDKVKLHTLVKQHIDTGIKEDQPPSAFHWNNDGPTKCLKETFRMDGLAGTSYRVHCVTQVSKEEFWNTTEEYPYSPITKEDFIRENAPPRWISKLWESLHTPRNTDKN